MCRSWHGDDDALVRERRGTTPLAHAVSVATRKAVTGPPVRVYWALLQPRCSSEGSPVMAGSVPMNRCYPAVVGPGRGRWYAEAMSNHTYRVIEIVGTSPEGIDAAIRNGLARAGETTRNLDWFEVLSVRGQLSGGAVAHVQVTMKVGFRIEEP
jgi:dodecin